MLKISAMCNRVGITVRQQAKSQGELNLLFDNGRQFVITRITVFQIKFRN